MFIPLIFLPFWAAGPTSIWNSSNNEGVYKAKKIFVDTMDVVVGSKLRLFAARARAEAAGHKGFIWNYISHFALSNLR